MVWARPCDPWQPLPRCTLKLPADLPRTKDASLSRSVDEVKGHGSQSGTPETPLGGCSGQTAGQCGWISFVLVQICSPEMGMGARLYEDD